MNIYFVIYIIVNLAINLILDKQQSLKENNDQKKEASIIEEIQELIKVRNIFADELGIIVTQ